MKKMLFITGAKGGPGKTLIALNCPQALTRLRYQPVAGDRLQHRLPRPTATRPTGIWTTVFRR
jgi:hypothetical protein